eukprot:5971977-Amphidinium_carterae.2
MSVCFTLDHCTSCQSLATSLHQSFTDEQTTQLCKLTAKGNVLCHAHRASVSHHCALAFPAQSLELSGGLLRLLSCTSFRTKERIQRTWTVGKLDVKSMSMYVGFGCKTRYFQKRRQLNVLTQQSTWLAL